MSWLRLGGGALMCAALLLVLGADLAGAQVPPPPLPPEAAEIASCLCLRQAVDALGANMTERERAYQAGREELSRLDAQLQSARAALNVEDPRAVAQFRQLLEQRDAASRHSSGAVFAEYSAAVDRYNARANEYNARCANRPMNPLLLNQVQATLVCPPAY